MSTKLKIASWVGLALVLALSLTAGHLALAPSGHLCDEICHHYNVIGRILGGDHVIDNCLTTLPGYHYLTAGILRVLGLSSLQETRALNCLWALALGLLAFAWFGDRGENMRWTRALQVFFLPVLAPYYNMVYTDTLAALLTLAAFICFERMSSLISGASAAGAIVVRQTQVVWAGFFLLLTVIREKVLRLDLTETAAGKKSLTVTFDQEAAKRALRGGLVPILLMALFCAWVVKNGGLSVGDRQFHPSFSLQLGNVWFFLALLPLLFLPMLVGSLTRLATTARQHWRVALPITLILYLVFLVTHKVDHPYNAIEPDYFAIFIRNQVLHWSVRNAWTLTASFSLVLLGAWLLWDWPFRVREYRWIIPVSFALFSFHWLIEQRYYIPTMAFLVMTRKEAGPVTEGAQLLWQIALVVAAVWGVASGAFLL